MYLKNIVRVITACFISALLLIANCVPAVADELDDERSRMKHMTDQVAKEIEKNFYDPKLNGLDWNALREQAKARIDRANSVGEMLTAIFIMVDKLQDSHTFFIPPARATTYKFGFEAKAIGPDIRVYELKANGAAQKAGLKLGDHILSINGTTAERRTFDLMMLYMRALRPVAAMDLKIQNDQEEPHIVHFEPLRVNKARIIDVGHMSLDVWDLITEAENEETIFHTSNHDGGIGYIEVKEFTDSSDFLDGLAEKVKGSKAIIIDLRDCPGGAQDTLKSFSGLFQSAPSDMAQIAYRNKTEPLTIKPRKPNFTGPMFILIDSRSGSAAEMFARHFQRTKRALVIGDHSPGRVTSARFFHEEMGTDRLVLYDIEIGMGRILFPDGEILEKSGVTPDQFCIPTGKDMREERDTCLNLAISSARKALNLPDPVAPKTATETAGKN